MKGTLLLSTVLSLVGHSLLVVGIVTVRERGGARGEGDISSMVTFHRSLGEDSLQSQEVSITSRKSAKNLVSRSSQRISMGMMQTPHTEVSSSEGRSDASAALLGDEDGTFGEYLGAQSVIAPLPEYPPLARRASFEGVVLTEVLVEKDGNPSEVTLLVSSGRDDCDEAAIATIRSAWRFAPATIKGAPVSSRVQIAVEYSLTNNEPRKRT